MAAQSKPARPRTERLWPPRDCDRGRPAVAFTDNARAVVARGQASVTQNVIGLYWLQIVRLRVCAPWQRRDNPAELSRGVNRIRSAQLLLVPASVPVAVAGLFVVPQFSAQLAFLVIAWIAAVVNGLVPTWFFSGVVRRILRAKRGRSAVWRSRGRRRRRAAAGAVRDAAVRRWRGFRGLPKRAGQPLATPDERGRGGCLRRTLMAAAAALQGVSTATLSAR